MDALKYLVGAYFHQDWDADGGEVADTVASFLRERRELVEACADQIDVLLSRGSDERQLRAQLDAWGCAYYAGGADDDYRAWLDQIGRQIRASLAKSAAP